MLAGGGGGGGVREARRSLLTLQAASGSANITMVKSLRLPAKLPSITLSWIHRLRPSLSGRNRQILPGSPATVNPKIHGR